MKILTKHGKQLLTAVLTAALLLGSLAVGTSAVTVDKFGDDHRAYDERLYGDINLDWKLDATDYMMVKRAVLGTYSIIVEQEVQAADVNQNGVIDAMDYVIIKRAILGTIEPLGGVVEELTPNPYADLTDEELYAQIDEMLANDPDPEGQNLLMFSFKRIKRESQASTVLASLGFSDDLYDKTTYIHVGHMTNMYLVLIMKVPPEQVREAIFKLYRCDEIGGCLTHGDQYSYEV